jgi:hypothetical protein
MLRDNGSEIGNMRVANPTMQKVQWPQLAFGGFGDGAPGQLQ